MRRPSRAAVSRRCADDSFLLARLLLARLLAVLLARLLFAGLELLLVVLELLAALLERFGELRFGHLRLAAGHGDLRVLVDHDAVLAGDRRRDHEFGAAKAEVLAFGH